MRRIILTILLCPFLTDIYSQNEKETSNTFIKIHYIGIESGIRTYTPNNKEHDFIRAESSNYYNINNNNYATRCSIPFISVKAESRLFHNKIWLSAGFNYSTFISKMARFDKYNYNSDYFYILVKKNESTSYYYRVKNIKEVNHYVGVPIDLRYSPFRERFFRLFFNIGVNLNLKVASSHSVTFLNPNLQQSENIIINLLDEADIFYASSTLGIGIQLGRQDRPNFRIEANFPSFILTPEAFSLNDYNFGGGGRISFMIPLKKAN